jgi:hypothetical protein
VVRSTYSSVMPASSKPVMSGPWARGLARPGGHVSTRPGRRPPLGCSAAMRPGGRRIVADVTFVADAVVWVGHKVTTRQAPTDSGQSLPEPSLCWQALQRGVEQLRRATAHRGSPILLHPAACDHSARRARRRSWCRSPRPRRRPTLRSSPDTGPSRDRSARPAASPDNGTIGPAASDTEGQRFAVPGKTRRARSGGRPTRARQSRCRLLTQRHKTGSLASGPPTLSSHRHHQNPYTHQPWMPGPSAAPGTSACSCRCERLLAAGGRRVCSLRAP